MTRGHKYPNQQFRSSRQATPDMFRFDGDHRKKREVNLKGSSRTLVGVFRRLDVRSSSHPQERNEELLKQARIDRELREVAGRAFMISMTLCSKRSGARGVRLSFRRRSAATMQEVILFDGGAGVSNA
jgi:hypothetical protein